MTALPTDLVHSAQEITMEAIWASDESSPVGALLWLWEIYQCWRKT